MRRAGARVTRCHDTRQREFAAHVWRSRHAENDVTTHAHERLRSARAVHSPGGVKITIPDLVFAPDRVAANANTIAKLRAQLRAGARVLDALAEANATACTHILTSECDDAIYVYKRCDVCGVRV